MDSIVGEVCCHGLALLVAEGGSYRFLHQDFRDYFAARHVQNQIRIALQQRALPEVLKKGPLDFYTRHLLGELEGEHYNKPAYLEKEKRWRPPTEGTLLKWMFCGRYRLSEQLGMYGIA